jgi:L-lactate dehydrogenase complex protein LldE
MAHPKKLNDLTVGLFIPCYINELYPQVGIATLEILEKLNINVVYPLKQTCCGQPMANAGYEEKAIGAYHNFVDNFNDFEYIVAPSGSCVHHVKDHYDIIPQTEEVKNVRSNVYELCDFLINVAGVKKLGAHFPYKVGLHKSCAALRGLRLGTSSEISDVSESVMEDLLNEVDGLELMELERRDECCGFGGTFSITEPAVSVKMGKDRIQDHLNSGVEVITATDTSCLMHMEGLINRNKQPIRVMHIAEILNSTLK